MLNMSRNEVNEILKKIRKSGAIGKSERQYKLLEYLLLSNAGLSENVVSEQSIALDVFGRPESFDRQTDSIVRAEMSRLRKNLSVFSKRNNELLVEIPGFSFNVIVSAKKKRGLSVHNKRHKWMLTTLVLFVLTGFYILGSSQNLSGIFGAPTDMEKGGEAQQANEIINQNLELALLVDTTMSMASVTKSLKENIKNFDVDLRSEMANSKKNIGSIKIKLIFFRDYMIDNFYAWEGPKMPLTRGMERYGPMYESGFFDLPNESFKLHEYADFFAARGGGGYVGSGDEESGLEAIWHAITATDWSSDPNTLRIIALWTDSPPRQLGDITDDTLSPDDASFNSVTWDRWIGPHFTAMNQADREQYMYDNFYPKDVPQTMRDFEASFIDFHKNNATINSGLETTLFVNIWGTCGNREVCGDWAKIETWDGVKVISQPAITSDEIYEDIVEQISYSLENTER